MTTRKTYLQGKSPQETLRRLQEYINWQRLDPQETLRRLQGHRTMLLGSDLVQSKAGLNKRFGMDLGTRTPSWHIIALISHLVQRGLVVAFDLEGEVAMLPASEWDKELEEQPDLAESRIGGPDFLERLLA